VKWCVRGAAVRRIRGGLGSCGRDLKLVHSRPKHLACPNFQSQWHHKENVPTGARGGSVCSSVTQWGLGVPSVHPSRPRRGDTAPSVKIAGFMEASVDLSDTSSSSEYLVKSRRHQDRTHRPTAIPSLKARSVGVLKPGRQQDSGRQEPEWYGGIEIEVKG